MEVDSSVELGSSLMFDFDFDDEVPLIDNPHSQAHPSQHTEKVVNFSHEKLGSSSSGSNPPVSMTTQNLTGVSGHTNTSEDLGFSLENATNLAPTETPSSNPDQLTETPQAKHPTTESPKVQPPAKENNQLPLSDQVNTHSNLSGNENTSQGATNNPLVSVPNLLPPVTSSISIPLSGAPQPLTVDEQLGNSSNSLQPSNSLEHVELGSSIGSNQSFLNYANSGQNLMGSAYSSGFGCTDPSHGNGSNLQQTKSTLFHSPLSGTTRPPQYPPVTAEMIPQIGVVPSFNSENEINLNHSTQLNTRSANGLQNELLPQQDMNPINPSSAFSAHQLAQNQRALPYTISFPQSATGLGTVNQQLPTWLSKQNVPYAPLAPSRSQINQFQCPPNVFDPQCTNPMLPASSVPLRPQYAANQLQLKQVPENVFNPQSQCFMIPEYPMLIRPQHLPYQSNQVPLAPNVQDSQRCNTILPVPSMALGLRPPEFFQFNQAGVTTGVSNLQFFNSLQPRAPLLPKIPELNDRNQAMMPETLMPPGSETFDFQGLLNQPSRPSILYPRPGSSQPNPVLNSSTQREIGGYNHAGLTFPQLELSLGNRNEQKPLGRRRGRAAKRYGFGESSSSSKRSRLSELPYERLSTSQSQENEVNNTHASSPLNISRPLKNTLYDPIYEGIGLPIDPHLRLFNSR